MPKFRNRFVNSFQTIPENGVASRSAPGAPKIPWTAARLRRILWLYTLTSLSVKQVVKVVDEGSNYHPQYVTRASFYLIADVPQRIKSCRAVEIVAGS